MLGDGRGLVHHRVEPVVFVGRVVHSAQGTVRLHDCVLPFDYVTIAALVMSFDITSVEVVHPIFEDVFWIRIIVDVFILGDVVLEAQARLRALDGRHGL